MRHWDVCLNKRHQGKRVPFHHTFARQSGVCIKSQPVNWILQLLAELSAPDK